MNVAAPARTAARRRAFVFVCQSGELEAKALLLAASLRRHLPAGSELIAAMPSPAQVWGEPSATTRAELDALEVTVAPIVNPLGSDYGIGNKLACIDVPTRATQIAFLDSDMLCLRDLGDPQCLQRPFAAKPADLRTFSPAADVWAPLYAAAGTTLPALRLPTTVSATFGPPYFNSGVVFVDAALGFGRTWIECAQAIADLPLLREQRHWLDQVALPIAVHRRGLAYAALDERFNFPAHLKPLPESLPFLCHYHWPRIVRREPALLGLVREIAGERPRIAATLRRHGAWAALVDTNPVFAAPRRHDTRAQPATSPIVVCGMPDCGAPQLRAALVRAGAVAVPDQESAAGWLGETATPRRLADAVQAASAAGPVVVGGEAEWICRLPGLRRALPAARFVACVDAPAPAIARWRQEPAAKAAAMVAGVALARRWSPELATPLEVDAGSDGERDARWWWWLAQRLIEHGDDLTVVRHGADVDAVAAALVAGRSPEPSGSLAELAEDDAAVDGEARQAIDAICRQAMFELGLDAA